MIKMKTERGGRMVYSECAIKEQEGHTKESNSPFMSLDLRNGKRRRILVVDDEKVIRDLLSTILSKLDYEVAVARNGDEALKQIKQDSFSLVLTDMQMRGIDGLTLAKRIKDHSPETPVIMITGERQEDIKEKIKEGPISYVIFKPFRLMDIQRKVRSFLNNMP
jgi:CheY-like chemotaxis protein